MDLGSEIRRTPKNLKNGSGGLRGLRGGAAGTPRPTGDSLSEVYGVGSSEVASSSGSLTGRPEVGGVFGGGWRNIGSTVSAHIRRSC